MLDPAVEELRQGLRSFNLLMLYDGTVERCEPSDVSPYEIAGKVEIWQRSKAPIYKGKGVQDALQFCGWAKDEAHAIKIANEHRARMIADGTFKAPL